MFTSDDIISIYTRAQAIADGTLIDITAQAQQAGFKFQVAITAGVMAEIQPPEEAEGQDLAGRIHDMLTMLHLAIRRQTVGTDRVDFAVWIENGRRRQPLFLCSICGPGDEGEPVITIMLPNED